MNDAEMNALPGAFVVIWIFGAIIAIIQVIGVWKMYKKAGIPLNGMNLSIFNQC